MTLGQKIKKYRLLKKMTQKELGIAVGFPASSADSRIRKCEIYDQNSRNALFIFK